MQKTKEEKNTFETSYLKQPVKNQYNDNKLSQRSENTPSRNKSQIRPVMKL